MTFPKGRGVGEFLVGIFGVITLAMGAGLAVDTSLTRQPGAMDTGFGQVFAAGLILVSTLALWWSLRRIRHFDARTRYRAFAWIGVTAAGATILFGSLSVISVVEHRAEERALRATISVRVDFEDDLADAYWAWYQDHGGNQRIYVGDMREWWSLDPDGDGQADTDAPVLRLLRDMGWSQRGVSMLDVDGDLVVDQLELRPTPGATGAQAWCVAVSKPGTVFVASWSDAAPRRCNGPSSSRVLP